MRRHFLITVSLLALSVGFVSPALGHQASGASFSPDADQRPVVESVSLELPQRHNDILEADLTINATDNGGVASYEYRWTGKTIGSILAADVDAPTVSYQSVDPESHQVLQVRAINTEGMPSDWFDAWSGTTPPVPNLIVAGDSIASGYTRQWFTSSGRCVDADASYGSTIHTRVASSLPPQWSPTYRNLAWAGALIGLAISMWRFETRDLAV